MFPRGARVGKVNDPDGAPIVLSCPSYPSRKNTLSFLIGPPMVAPKSSISVTCFGVPDWMNGFLASNASLRPNAYAVPCNVLSPDLRPTLTTAPGFHPY